MMTDEGRERKERREAEEQARINDDRAALEVLRLIRDNPKALPETRVEAIRMISRITRK